MYCANSCGRYSRNGDFCSPDCERDYEKFIDKVGMYGKTRWEAELEIREAVEVIDWSLGMDELNNKEKNMDTNSIANAINTLEDVDIKEIKADTLVFTYGGVPVVAALTDESPARLRFSIDVKKLDIENDEALAELLYKLLDINTEIDPVAAAIDSTDPENIVIQVRHTLEIVDLQDSEIVAAVKKLIGALSDVFGIVSEQIAADIVA